MQIMCLPAPVVGDGEGRNNSDKNLRFPPAKTTEFWTRLCLSRSFFPPPTNQADNGTAANEGNKDLAGAETRLGLLPLAPLTKNSLPLPRKRETHRKNCPSDPVARTRGEREREQGARPPFSALDSQPLGSPGAAFFKGRIEKSERRFDQGEEEGRGRVTEN